MIFEPFSAKHVMIIDLQNKQGTFESIIKDFDFAKHIEESHIGWSLLNDEKTINYASFGYSEIGYGRFEVWSILSKDSGKHLKRITKFIQNTMDLIEYRRVELLVEDGFDEAHRWARILGFNCDTPDGMLNYINGKTFYLYAKIK